MFKMFDLDFLKRLSAALVVGCGIAVALAALQALGLLAGHP
jgi:hypothetical protein